jgi:NAD(P)-dependent dehydrogenase (short-subunit alcohol dehydrogenase family)
MVKLKGKICIVTGGGSGIGRGIALAFASHGAKVVICGRREQPLDETAKEIRQSGGVCLSIKADVSRLEDVERLVKNTLDEYKRVDILVNNAGIGGGGSIHKHNVDLWDQIMAVNLRGPFLLSREVLPHMRTQNYGHIVNISSESGLEYYPGNGAYGVSKHALNDLGEYIQRENQEFNIRIDTVCPGMVVTEMSENSPGLDHSNCLYPEDIADLVVWLVTRRENVKIGRPILIQTMENPWE